MPAHRRYANAPITEALIDIQVSLPPDVKLAAFDDVYNRVKADYPSRGDAKLVGATLSFGEQVSASAKQDQIGYILRTKDGKNVVQVRLNGFTFSRLRPYEHWDALRDEARRIWDIYRDVARPIKVTRVALRYINQFDIGVPMDFRDYFRTFPEVSSDLPQQLSGFLMQVQIPREDFKGFILLTQTMVPPPDEKTASVILDIDTYRQEVDFASDGELWRFLEQLRDRKNEVFEGCITNRTRQLIGPLME